MYGVTGSPLFGLAIIKILLLIKYLIYFKVYFNEDFLTSSGDLVTSGKILDSGIKCGTSNPNDSKLSNELFNLFTTALNTLCKPLLILFT